MLPALLRVRPQPGALPEAKRQELQQTLPLLPQAPVPVMGAGMRGRSARARGFCIPIVLRPCPHGPRQRRCKFNQRENKQRA